MTLRNVDEIHSSRVRVESVNQGLAVLLAAVRRRRIGFGRQLLRHDRRYLQPLFQVTCAVSCSHRLAGPATRNTLS